MRVFCNVNKILREGNNKIPFRHNEKQQTMPMMREGITAFKINQHQVSCNKKPKPKNLYHSF